MSEPRDKMEADSMIAGKECPVCSSHLLLPIKRDPLPWRAHCNHCGSEVQIHVLCDLEKWRQRA